MYLNSPENNKDKCCGCGACSQICPKNCITMEPDADGFVFPVVDKTLCINCHQCERVCPFNNLPVVENRIEEDRILAFRDKDETEVLKSASGGAFFAIINVLKEFRDLKIYGAIIDDDLKVKHHCFSSSDHLDALHKSKYVQSDLGNSFVNIRNQLKNGEHVLFSGTPCQVAALRNFLVNSNTDNLFCVDLVCHGVPNQKMFDEYIKDETKLYRKKIKKIEFRHKVKKPKIIDWDSKNLLLSFDDSTSISKNRYDCAFLRAYQSFLFFRDSCHNCPYANKKRYGDLTIGDFWGVNKFLSNINEEKGISLIKINTKKGEEIINTLSNRDDLTMIVEADAYLKRTSGAMKSSSPKNINREKFLEYAQNHSFFQSVDKFVPKWKEIIKIEVARKINPNVRIKIKRVLNSIRKRLS